MTDDRPPRAAPKVRLLHEGLARVVAGLRHGEMVCISDAGAGSSPKALVPLAPDVERIDLGVATGIPTTRDVVAALYEVGDFESAIVADVTPLANRRLTRFLTETFGEENLHVIDYFPAWYELRNRVKVFVQTGDYGLAASTILVAGFPSTNIPVDWLQSDDWYTELVAQGGKYVNDGTAWRRVDSAETEG